MGSWGNSGTQQPGAFNERVAGLRTTSQTARHSYTEVLSKRLARRHRGSISGRSLWSMEHRRTTTSTTPRCPRKPPRPRSRSHHPSNIRACALRFVKALERIKKPLSPQRTGQCGYASRPSRGPPPESYLPCLKLPRALLGGCGMTGERLHGCTWPQLRFPIRAWCVVKNRDLKLCCRDHWPWWSFGSWKKS